jgi:predicted nuclease with TOPRIM domain
MDWSQFVIFAFSVLGLFFWNRSESRSDMRHMQTQLQEHRKETTEILKGIQQEVKGIQQEVKGIQEEMKDFHGRLCAIEERNKGK